jgi:hypothetical protein
MIFLKTLEHCPGRKMQPSLSGIDIHIHGQIVMTRATVRHDQLGLVMKAMPRPLRAESAR